MRAMKTFFICRLILPVLQLQVVLCGSEHLKRLRRSLIFPEKAPTIMQIIGGIGIPVDDLDFESITSGYVLKTGYFLPINASELTQVYLRPQPITGRRNKDNIELPQVTAYNYAAIYRWIVYGALETVLKNVGLPGRSCMLRVICEHAALPLSHESGLLAEMLHIILTPSSSRDSLEKKTNRIYRVAERRGRRGRDCAAAYGKMCQKSPIDMISVIFKVKD